MILILGVLALLLIAVTDPEHARLWELPRLAGTVFCFLVVIHSFRSIERQAIRAMRMALVVRQVSERESQEKPTEDQEG
jgi:hypothetical protein